MRCASVNIHEITALWGRHGKRNSQQDSDRGLGFFWSTVQCRDVLVTVREARRLSWLSDESMSLSPGGPVLPVPTSLPPAARRGPEAEAVAEMVGQGPRGTQPGADP